MYHISCISCIHHVSCLISCIISKLSLNIYEKSFVLWAWAFPIPSYVYRHLLWNASYTWILNIYQNFHEGITYDGFKWIVKSQVVNFAAHETIDKRVSIIINAIHTPQYPVGADPFNYHQRIWIGWSSFIENHHVINLLKITRLSTWENACPPSKDMKTSLWQFRSPNTSLSPTPLSKRLNIAYRRTS